MAKAFLSAIRPAPFGFSKEESSTIAEEIIRLLNSNRYRSVEAPVISRNCCENDVVYRCGIPFEDAFKIDQKALFWNNIYPSNVENMTEEYLTSFAVKRDMFHAFFGILDVSEFSVEYDHFRSILPNLQTEGTSTNQINFSQLAESRMTQTSQLMPMIHVEESSMEIPQSRIEASPTLEMPIIPQSMLTMSHVPETGRNVTVQSHDSSQTDCLANAPMIPPINEIVTLTAAVAKYGQWKINPRAHTMMILVELDEVNAEQMWRIWYVLRSDRANIMTILPSRVTYYYGDRRSNKRRRTVDFRQICDGNMDSLVIPQEHHQDLVRLFIDDENQEQNDELRHWKNTPVTFDDSRPRTQIGGIMTVANRSFISQEHRHIEDDDIDVEL